MSTKDCSGDFFLYLHILKIFPKNEPIIICWQNPSNNNYRICVCYVLVTFYRLVVGHLTFVVELEIEMGQLYLCKIKRT